MRWQQQDICEILGVELVKESCEAGICLTGTEIKSIRSGKVNISDAYVKIDGNEAMIINMNISHYDHGNIFNVDEKRPRKLLLHTNFKCRYIG